MTTSKTTSKRTEKQLAGFAVTLTPVEIYAQFKTSPSTSAATLQRIAAAANDSDHPGDQVELVREILGTADTCAGLAEKMGGLVGRTPASHPRAQADRPRGRHHPRAGRRRATGAKVRQGFCSACKALV